MGEVYVVCIGLSRQKEVKEVEEVKEVKD